MEGWRIAGFDSTCQNRDSEPHMVGVVLITKGTCQRKLACLERNQRQSTHIEANLTTNSNEACGETSWEGGIYWG